MAGEDRILAGWCQPHRFSDRSVALPALEDQRRWRNRHVDAGCRREWRAVRRLSAQAEFLRSRGSTSNWPMPCSGLRFEYPDVKVVVMRSGKNRVFCAGANIRMLAGATHAHKVNFCKFTNETRNGLEDSSENSGQRFITVVNGTAAGGGYELALATDHIILADDGAAAVSLPEVPLLAVLPGHRRTDARGRQAQGAPRSRRFLLHHRGRHQGQAGCRLAAGRRDRAQQQARSQGRRAHKRIRRRLEAQRQRQGDCADAAESEVRRQRRAL